MFIPVGLSIVHHLLEAKAFGIPPLDAELLMLHALGKHQTDRAWLRSHKDDTLSAKLADLFDLMCQRHLDDEPIAYILGCKDFYGLNLRITPSVLDPRSDTETLVDWALDVLGGLTSPYVTDLGTGSGAIALAIKRHRPDAYLLAIDASLDALTVAQANAEQLKLKVEFRQGNWLEPLPKRYDAIQSKWHLIASNPPYIAENDPHLPALRHEPREALTSGADGLDDIRHIVAHAPTHLRIGGWLLLEHGHDQAPAVQALMRVRGFQQVQSRNDLGDIARCTGGIWRGGSNA